MRVRVLVAGVYNGPGHRTPQTAQPGDVIEVPAGWYAESLIASGFVTAQLVAPVIGPTETQVAAGPSEAPAAVKRPAARKRKPVT